ncbi:MAG: energy transducer TonB [Rhizomicrobium sp.]
MLLIGASPAWAADADKACSAPDAPLRPIMATHTIPPYPEVSVMTKESGSTLMEVVIGPDGVPTKVSVLNSSGSLRLDAAAADYVKNTWRWNAPVHNCQPLAVATRVSVAWDLRDAIDTGPRPPSVNMNIADYPPAARQRHEQGTVVLLIVVSPNGAVNPTVQTSSGFAELDQKSVELARTWHFTPASLDGRAVVTGVFLLSVWSLDAKP